MKRQLLLLHVAAALALFWAGGIALAAEPATTRYSGDGLVLDSTTADGGWSATVLFNGKPLTLVGKPVENEIRGTLHDPANPEAKFPFTAKLDGRGGLTLATGTKTYQLKAGPPAPPPGRDQPIKQAGELPQGAVRLRRVAVGDQDRNGQTAFTLLAPADWKVQGGVLWTINPANPAAPGVSVSDPRGVEVYNAYPQFSFVHGVRENAFANMLGATPADMEKLLRDFPDGTLSQRVEMRQLPQDVEAVIRSILIPRSRKDLAQTRWQVVSVADMPELAQATLEFVERGSTVVCKRVRIAYEENRAAIEEEFFITFTRNPPIGQHVVCWNVASSSFRAAKGQLDARIKLAQVMSSSIRIDLQWSASVDAIGRILKRQTQRDNEVVRLLGVLIRETREEISEVHRQTAEARYKAQERISEERGKALKGVEYYRDPYDATRRVELPAGYYSVFSNPKGEYILTDDPNFDPVSTFQEDWRRAEPARR